MFGNNKELMCALKNAGKQTNEEVWEMPLVDYHRELVKHVKADITNHSQKLEAGSSQAAAFLEVISLKYYRTSLKKESSGFISIFWQWPSTTKKEQAMVPDSLSNMPETMQIDRSITIKLSS